MTRSDDPIAVRLFPSAVHRVALVVDPSPALLAPLVRGLGGAGYDVAFSAPAGAGRGLAPELRRRGRRAFALDRSLDPDVVVESVREELGRLDLVVVEPARAESAPELGSADPGREVAPRGSPALGAARAALHLLGESGGSIVRLLRPPVGDAGSVLEESDVEATRRLGRSLGARVRVNGVAVPVERTDRAEPSGGASAPDATPPPSRAGVGRDDTADAVVRAVLWLAGSNHLNGEVVSIDPGRSGRRP